MEQLKLIRQTYRALYNRDLLDVFYQRDNPFAVSLPNLSNEVEVMHTDVPLALMMCFTQRVAYLRASEPSERDAEIVRGALFGQSLDPDTLTEIVCTRSSLELSSAKNAYQARYNSNLEQDVSSKAIGSLKEVNFSFVKLF